jgi:hypothetical protein
MAVIEIARIQVRRGQENQTGVPVLAGGEFGWAADTERLFIGLRRDDGGSRDANIELLTENHLRNFFSSATTATMQALYTYQKGSDITKLSPTSLEIARPIQQKLDSVDPSVLDFGGSSGLNDNTTALRVAVENLFLDPLQTTPLYSTSSTSRILRIPSGFYNIADTIFIPKNTTIVGDGIDKTIINLTSTGSHVFQTIDSTSIGSAGGAASYVTFPSIATPGTPDNIHIEGMTLQYATTTNISNCLSLISLDVADNAVIRNVKFSGNYTPGLSTNTNYAGIDIRAYGITTSEFVSIDECEFNNLVYGVKSNHDIISPMIGNSQFKDMYRGIVFNDPVDPIHGLVGPRFARISNNRFKRIEAEAIYAGVGLVSTTTNHISNENQFMDCGNLNYGPNTSTGTAVITFAASSANVSVDDYFDRLDYQARNVGAGLAYFPLIDGRAAIDNSFTSIRTIAASATSYIKRVPITSFAQLMLIKYSATSVEPTDRKGILRVNIGQGASPACSITDDYDYVTSGDGTLLWLISTNPTLKYVDIRLTNGSAFPVTVEYQISHML